MAGAFDSFGTIKREQFFALTEGGEVFLDVLVRYGNRFQADKANAAASLFGSAAPVDIAKPALPTDFEPWTDLKRLGEERNLIGVYISGHPLDKYAVILNDVCNTHMAQLEDLEALQGKDLTMGGNVVGLRKGQTKTGKPYGIARIEDFDASGEIALFGEDWARWGGYFDEGNSLFITARAEQRPWRPGSYDLKITRVEFLDDIKDSKIERFTITAQLDQLDTATAGDLAAMLQSRSGHVPLFFEVADATGGAHLLFEAKGHTLDVDKELTDYIKANPALGYKIN